nr:uncharacterized protein LOC123769878 [Procambarus clarkii]XP_045617248.1 uncharacterized protein LOC123769878 [Procambarus clarkii]
MKLLNETRCVMLLLIATGMLLSASLSTRINHTFRLLFKGGQMINGIYSYVGPNFIIQCAGRCGQKVGCWAFTWDSVSLECHLLSYLTSPVTLQSASVSLHTYYVADVNNVIMTMTSYVSTWNEGQAACEALGGRMAVPADVTYGSLLQYVFNTVAYYVGMWRYENNINIWYDVDSKVVSNWMVISTCSYQSIVMLNSLYESMVMSNSSYESMVMSNSSYESLAMSNSSYESLAMSNSSYESMAMWDSWFQPNGTCCYYVNGVMVQVDCSYPVWIPVLCEV